MKYYENPYQKEYRAKVLKSDNETCMLDDTILYEGGGGQPPDRGYAICNSEKVDIRHIGSLKHECKCDSEELTIHLDWDFRYEMMKAHSAEHTFFRFLQNRGAELIKINLNRESSILFKGDITLDDVITAESKTIELIKSGREVQWFWIDESEIKDYPELRIKKERIKSEKIRVVEIAGHDISACKGIHVKNLSEIGDFAITKFRDGKKKEVKFVVGDRAIEFHHLLSSEFRRSAWENEIEVQKYRKFVLNIINEVEVLNSAIKELSSKIPFEEMNCNKIKIFILDIPRGDKKIIRKRMMEMVQNKNEVSLFIDSQFNEVSFAVSEDLMFMIPIVKDLIEQLGGKGGGNRRFVSGYVPNTNEFRNLLISKICKGI